VLLNRLAVDDADVVHFHGDDWFTLRRPRPTVRTLHGTALREAQQATRMLRRIEQYLLVPAERLSTRLATASVAVGADAAAVHGLSQVIGNGVDRTLFRPGTKSERPSILYVGTWNGRKRGRWLYELFVEHVAPRRPDVELHFVADHEPPAHPQVRSSRFPDDDALARAYREAWVFALPSTYEGFGIPYLEAMASGTPVLATPNPGAIELLGNGRYGVIADDDDYADALHVLLGDAAARARLAEAGLTRAREFDWSEIAKAYRAVYAEALEQASRARAVAREPALAPVGR
jgi:phosphatidyl-myo-inositol alpha-mannosyltransferase